MLNKFFPIVDTCLNCEDNIADKVARWCADGNFLHHICVLCFQRTASAHFRPAF